MKKNLFLAAILFMATLHAFAQNVNNPNVENTESRSTVITKIETDKQYTIVHFDHYALTDNAWVVLNPEIYIQTDVDNKHYDYVKAEGIAVAPQQRKTIAKAGEKVSFKVFFKKLPENAKLIDVIERAGRPNDETSYFNFYNIDLTKSNPGEQRIKVQSVTLTPPPPINQTTDYSQLMEGMGSGMASMYSNITKSMLDAQLNYYKQPGKIAEFAQIQRQYYMALLKQGFNQEQAMKILTSADLLPKVNMSGK